MPVLADKLYIVLKYIAQIFLPALATFYLALSAIVDVPAVEQVVAVIVAFDTFLGTLLHVSTQKYVNSDAAYDGNLVVMQQGDKTIYSAEFNDALESLQNKKSVSFKVTDASTPGYEIEEPVA